MGEAAKPDEAESKESRQVGGETSQPVESREEGAGLNAAGPGEVDPGLDVRFKSALVLYGILGLLVWFTMGEGKVLVHGRPIELRLVPLIVLGGLALRTVVAHRAEKIRQGGA